MMGVSLHPYQTERYKERIEYAMAIKIRNGRYMLGVVKGVGGNPVSLKVWPETKNNLIALYGSTVASDIDDSTVKNVATEFFEALSSNNFRDFPKNMPKEIELTISGKEYKFTWREPKK